MDSTLEILKYTLPALIVLITSFIMIRGYIRSEELRREREISGSSNKTLLPIRLQAYERMALFLERISPESLVLRVNKPGMSAKQLHAELLSTVRSEYEHNLSQQVYISTRAWELVRAARGNVVNLINAAGDQVKEDATAITLSQKIFEQVVQLKSPPAQEALEFLKKEIRELF